MHFRELEFVVLVNALFGCHMLLSDFLFGSYLNPEDGDSRLTFYGPHGAMSQKVQLFVTTAVRTSNPQNYWVPGLGPSFGFLNTRKHDVSVIGSVSVLR
jgi:hypothetical protein